MENLIETKKLRRNSLDITALYTFIDDFFKEISSMDHWKSIEHYWQGARGPKKNLSLSEVVTLNILRFYLRVTDLKSFHRLVKESYKREFPSIPNYENFLKATNKSAIFCSIFLQYLASVNRLKSAGEAHFIDSTPISVCKNLNIYRHKVTKGMAERGKSTKGWFYGFKLHGVCNSTGDLENIFFTAGNVHDSQILEPMVQNLSGTITCDAGYLVKKEVLERIYQRSRRIYIATRRNMNCLMTEEQKYLFRKRSRIETVWGVLKERFNIIYHIARSPQGMFRHFFYSILSYMLYNSQKELFQS